MNILFAMIIGGIAGYTVGESVKSYGRKNKWSDVRILGMTCILSVIVGLILSKLL